MGVRTVIGCGLGLLAAGAMAAATTGTGRTKDLPSIEDRPRFGQVEIRCSACHHLDRLFSHPVGIIPSMSIPAGLPLDDGRLTCSTCHEVRDCLAPADGPAGRMPRLRNELTAAELCVACHNPSDTGRSHLHGAALQRAHLERPHGGRSGGDAGWPAETSDFDVSSAACLSCHDGSVASDVTHEIGALRGIRGLGNSHPIGVEYRPRGLGALRPAEQLDRRIRLFDNRVGCGSCHSPYSPEDSLLVMSNERSRLCLSCHDF